MKSKSLLVLLIWVGFLAACRSVPGREIRIKEVPPGSWSDNHPVTLTYENDDTLAQKTLSVLVRFRSDFSYDRLDFVLETLTPDSLSWRDTLSVCFDPAAEATETTSLTYVDSKVKYRTESLLSRAGAYSFTFTPLMPDTPVNGIIGVGIEISNE